METGIKTEILETGFVQKREWMLYKIREDHYPLNIIVDFSLDSFDRDVFQKTVDLLVLRHEIFRTTLQVIGGSLKQVIHDPEKFHVGFNYYDLSGSSPAERELFTGNKMLLLSYMPFNFEFGPLLRIAVFKTAEEKFDIVFIFHHLIFDNISVQIFKADAVRIWGQLMYGESGLPDTEQPQYRTYVAFEQKLLNSSLGDAHRHYWSLQLKEAFPRFRFIDAHAWKAYQDRQLRKVQEVKRRIFSLPFYDRRFLGSVVRRYSFNQAGVICFDYSRETIKQVFEYKNNRNSNLHSVFLAGFILAFHKLCGQEKFVFDIPAYRRTDGVFKSVIGWLAAGGVCYFDIQENKSPAAWLQYIDRQLSHLAKHCVYPFEILDYESAIPLGGAVPVFFTVSETFRAIGPGGGSGIVSHDTEGSAVYEEMAVFLDVYTDACRLKMMYDNSIIPAGIVEKFMWEQEGCLRNLLREIL